MSNLCYCPARDRNPNATNVTKEAGIKCRNKREKACPGSAQISKTQSHFSRGYNFLHKAFPSHQPRSAQPRRRAGDPQRASSLALGHMPPAKLDLDIFTETSCSRAKMQQHHKSTSSWENELRLMWEEKARRRQLHI